MAYVIAEPCIDVMERACVEERSVDCIYEGERTLHIQPDDIDCAACEPVCPVEAIAYEDDLPEIWQEYTAINREFFDDGSAGWEHRAVPRRSARSRRTIRRSPPGPCWRRHTRMAPAEADNHRHLSVTRGVIIMTDRTATNVWESDLFSGKGTTSLDSSQAVGPPTRVRGPVGPSSLAAGT